MHLFRPSRDLLELQVMEIDESLMRFFEAHMEPDMDETTFLFVNDDGLERKMKVVHGDRLLQGRGIKGFFAPYEQAEWLLARMLPDRRIAIGWPIAVQSDWRTEVSERPDTLRQMEQVLASLCGMRQDDHRWFELYDASQRYVSAGADELIGLPHIRELQPYAYQVKTALAVIGRFRGRALLCDEVGLGKTIEAGICMQEYIVRGLARRILVLVPPSLMNQWAEEMKRKFNQDFIRSDDPAFTAMGSEAWSHFPKIIASLSTAKRANHREVIVDIPYDLVIVDEAHHVKNRNTQAWKFINRLQKKYILLLTATPVQNSLEELYNLITLLKPGQLNTYAQFKRNFVEDNRGIEAKNVNQLKALLSDVMIRNRRSTVDVAFTKRSSTTDIVQLADREQRLYAEISGFIRRHYLAQHPVFSRFLLKTMQEQMGSSFASIAPSLHKLAGQEKLEAAERRTVEEFYQAANEIAATEAVNGAKLEATAKFVTGLNDKVLVFTKYKATLDVLAAVLRERGLEVAVFHGGLRRQDKEQAIAAFRDSAQVLVSTEVGGEGRNLQFCNALVNFDLPWNPMAIEQRIGRIHRIGQTRDVSVYNLAARHTLEHYMLHVLDRKINLFELVVGEVDMIMGDLDEREEFSDTLMDAWTMSEDSRRIEQEMDKIGDKLLQNKQQLDRVKALDQKLFV
ncbi:DEAD/DEAH box helicase [Paenibacillus sabuli]|nr:SNF2-related protein [Paenibacillus sabuli]